MSHVCCGNIGLLELSGYLGYLPCPDFCSPLERNTIKLIYFKSHLFNPAFCFTDHITAFSTERRRGLNSCTTLNTPESE